MAYSVNTIIRLAEKEVGYLEKKTNSQLDHKTKNAGSNNYTKYARDLHNAGYYNGNKNGHAWCDVFVDWLFFKAFGKEVGQKLQCQTGNLGAGCQYSAQYYEKEGRLFKKPAIGDQIFFKNSSGSIHHTGIVVDVTSSKVFTIEGNTSSASGVIDNGGGVSKKSYAINDSRIYGYGRPRYDNDDVDKSTEMGGVCQVDLPVLKRGAKGDSVKALQTLLIGYGCPCGVSGVDGNFGADTLRAVKVYQKNNKLDVDGAVGPATWAKLLGTK